jgi:hypothetical protein
MPGSSTLENILVALASVAPLAVWPMLPLLALCYVRQHLPGCQMRPAFALHKSEEDELERALKLLERVQARWRA